MKLQAKWKKNEVFAALLESQFTVKVSANEFYVEQDKANANGIAAAVESPNVPFWVILDGVDMEMPLGFEKRGAMTGNHAPTNPDKISMEMHKNYFTGVGSDGGKIDCPKLEFKSKLPTTKNANVDCLFILSCLSSKSESDNNPNMPKKSNTVPSPTDPSHQGWKLKKAYRKIGNC